MKRYAIILMFSVTQTSFAVEFCNLSSVNQKLNIAPPRTVVYFGDKNVTPVVIREGIFRNLVLNVRLGKDGTPWAPSTLEQAAFAFVNYLPNNYLSQVVRFKSFDDIAINDSKSDVRERIGDIAYFIDKNWAASLYYQKDCSLTDDILKFLNSVERPTGWRCKKAN